MCVWNDIYIYIYRERERESEKLRCRTHRSCLLVSERVKIRFGVHLLVRDIQFVFKG